MKGGEIEAVILNCKICPKRVAGYEFEGTACPWGGLLAGFLEEVLGRKIDMSLEFHPGEKCKIKLRSRS